MLEDKNMYWVFIVGVFVLLSTVLGIGIAFLKSFLGDGHGLNKELENKKKEIDTKIDEEINVIDETQEEKIKEIIESHDVAVQEVIDEQQKKEEIPPDELTAKLLDIGNKVRQLQHIGALL